ncbi:MAG: phosphatidylinositol mannoside acyltransferase [Actinomycetota bacterium]
MASLRGRLATLPYRIGEGVAQVVPPRVGLAAARAGGALAVRVDRGRRRMVARHQHRVRGHDDNGAVTATFQSYARYWYEMFRLPADVRRDELDAHLHADGWDHVDAGLARGKGVIVALPHLGGWEYGAAWVARAKGHRMLAVVEPLQPPEVYEWFVAQRRTLGLDIVPLGHGVATDVLAALRANRIVCLLCDRDLTGDGIEVDFFGERTTLPAGPGTLALRSDAALIPAAVYFGAGRHHEAVVRPAIPVARAGGRIRDDVARITQDIAREFETLIREAPDQWHLMQPNWPSDRVAQEA